MQPEMIADYACVVGENPLWHPDEQRQETLNDKDHQDKGEDVNRASLDMEKPRQRVRNDPVADRPGKDSDDNHDQIEHTPEKAHSQAKERFGQDDQDDDEIEPVRHVRRASPVRGTGRR